MPAHHVLIVLFDGVQSLDVTGPLEVFTGASRLEPGRYRISTGSVGGVPARTSSGLELTPDLALTHPPDTLSVPGGAGTRPPPPELVAWLRANGDKPQRLVSVCSGAFLLAEAGLLDGLRATTHGEHCDSLARRFPEIAVESEPIFVRDGRVSTSAGVTAGIDLALALVEDDLGRDAGRGRRGGPGQRFRHDRGDAEGVCAGARGGPVRIPPPVLGVDGQRMLDAGSYAPKSMFISVTRGYARRFSCRTDDGRGSERSPTEPAALSRAQFGSSRRRGRPVGVNAPAVPSPRGALSRAPRP